MKFPVDKYTNLALRTLKSHDDQGVLILLVLANFMEEALEVCELLDEKGSIAFSSELSEELGDLCWVTAVLAFLVGVTLEDDWRQIEDLRLSPAEASLGPEFGAALRATALSVCKGVRKPLHYQGRAPAPESVAPALQRLWSALAPSEEQADRIRGGNISKLSARYNLNPDLEN